MAIMEIPDELCADDVWDMLSVQGGIACLSPEKMQELVKKLKVVKDNAIRRALALFMGDLYDQDIDSLERDITKTAFLDAKIDVRPELQERVKLLRILWWIIAVYFDDDISLAVRTCKEINPMRNGD